MTMTTRTMTDDPAVECGCAEYAGLSRRGVLAGGAALAGVASMTTVIGDAVLQSASASLGPARSTLVVLSLRGAADGLSMVVPHGDPAYYRARPHIAVPASSLWGGDGFFGWNPHLKALEPLWRSGRLAAVHATGLPAPNRSHFSAMEELEDAAPGSQERTGWLNRLIGLDSDRPSPLQAMAVTDGAVPSSLCGPEPTMSALDPASVMVAGATTTSSRRVSSLRQLWAGRDDALGRAAGEAFTAVEDFTPVRRGSARPANGASYPAGDLGKAMASAARIIKGDVGVEVLTIDQGSWDMHSGLGTVEGGAMMHNCADLGAALAAFFDDLGSRADNVTVVTLTEFGRRVVENENRGLDHGFGSVMLLAGAGVRGGRFYGTFPQLGTDLDSDLTVTTDYRSILAEVVSRRFGASTSTVFPGFNPRPLGVMTD